MLSPMIHAEKGFEVPPQKSPEQRYGEYCYARAIDLLTRYLPQLKPLEETVLVSRFDPEERPYYYGKLRGKHYVAMTFGGGGYKSYKHWVGSLNSTHSRDIFMDEQNVVAVAHELIHQRQAEQFGQKAVIGEDLDLIISDEDYENSSPEQLIQLLHARTGEGFTLEEDVLEGSAQMVEHYLIGKRIEEELSKPESIRLGPLISYKWASLRQLLSYAQSEEYGKYLTGFEIMRKLYKRFGLGNLEELIKAIDLQQCEEILPGTDRYNMIVQDPSKLPGLENNPIIAGGGQ